MGAAVVLAGACSGSPEASGAVGVAPPVPLSAGVRRVCARLAIRLPDRLEQLARRPAVPVSAQTAAWGAPAVRWRCGVGTPAGYGPGASLAGVDGVDWYQQVAASGVTWTAVGRVAQVELTVPTVYSAQAGFLVDAAGVISGADPLASRR